LRQNINALQYERLFLTFPHGAKLFRKPSLVFADKPLPLSIFGCFRDFAI